MLHSTWLQSGAGERCTVLGVGTGYISILDVEFTSGDVHTEQRSAWSVLVCAEFSVKVDECLGYRFHPL